jgi:hypothetical protein
MTMQEAIALQPQWVQLWLNWMMIGAFILPLGLFIWKQTRVTAVYILLSDVLAAFSTDWLYNKLGYVKLLGLPHLFLWTPLAIYLYLQLKRTDIPKYARWIIIVVLATITVSLAFDYTDVARYVLGNRGAVVGV